MTDWLAVRGHRLEWAAWGAAAPDRPQVLLLHEGLGSVSTWRDFPAALAGAAGARVLAYSRRGHGRSDARGAPHGVAFMHDEARDELPAVLDALGLARPILLGHSDGASVALLFAAAHPERVQALILEAPHVFVEDVSVASIARMRTDYETTDLRARLVRHHGANVDEAFRGWNDIWLDPAFRAWNIEDVLPRVACPTLVIQGEDDEYGTTRQVDAIARQAGGAVQTLLLPACGHAPHRDQPAAVLAATAAFISAAGRSSRSTAG